MSFTPPSLEEVLTNEQTLNTNLISFRSELRDALDTLGIAYESSDAILDLIRLLDWVQSKEIDIDSASSNDHVLELISNHIAMVGPAHTYEPDLESGWQLSQSRAAPDYRFIPYTLAYYGGHSSAGNATGAWMFTNEETSFTLNQDWTYDCYIHPQSGISGTDVYRGLVILLGSDWSDYSTYQGWCAGISLQRTTYKGFYGVWNSTNEASMTNLDGSIYTGETYHIQMKYYAINHKIYVRIYLVDEGEDMEMISSSTISVRDVTTDYTQEVRFGMLSKFYAYESPLYGPGYPLSNVKVK